MKIQQRHLVYQLAKGIFNERTRILTIQATDGVFCDGLCSCVYDAYITIVNPNVSWDYFLINLEKLFPELHLFKPKNILFTPYSWWWPRHTKQGVAKRRSVLDKCIEMTAPNK